MPSSINAPTSVKEFDARTASITVGGTVINDLESFGYDQSKDHDLQYTIDQGAVWVKATPELTGTFVMKATSENIADVEGLFLDDEVFQITCDLADNAGQDTVQFIGCMLTDFSQSDYEIDGMPTLTGEFQAVNRGSG